MNKEEIQKEIDNLKKQLSSSKRASEDLEVELKFWETINSDLDSLSKRESELPPGFEIHWFNRRDPFESVYALYLHGEFREMASDKYDEHVQQINLRKKAWEAWDFATKIIGPFLDRIEERKGLKDENTNY